MCHACIYKVGGSVSYGGIMLCRYGYNGCIYLSVDPVGMFRIILVLECLEEFLSNITNVNFCVNKRNLKNLVQYLLF